MKEDSPSSMSGARRSLRPPPQSTGRDPYQTSQAGRGKSSGCSSPLSPLDKDYQSQVERLRAELEAERLRSKEAQRCFAVEAREIREAAKKDQQLLADNLQSRWEQEWACDLDELREDTEKKRKAEIRQLLRLKEAELREAQELLWREHDTALQQARDLQSQLASVLLSCGDSSLGAGGDGSDGGLSSECRARLQEFLGKHQGEVESDQATQIHHLRAKLKLQRRLFLQYILEHTEGEPFLAGSIDRSRQASSLQRLGRASPQAPESATADATPDILAVSKTSTLVNHQTRCEPPSHCPVRGEGSARESCSPEQPHEQAKEWHGVNESEQEVSVDSAPQSKVNSCGAAGEHAPEGLVLQDQLPGNSCNLLLKQNTDLFKAVEVLRRTCTHLREENTQLRMSSTQVLQEKTRLLQRKSAQLDALAKRLAAISKERLESVLRVSNTPGPLDLNCSETEWCKNMLAQQQAEELNDPTIPKEHPELQVDLSSRKTNTSFLNTTDSDCLPRWSQREGQHLQGEFAHKSQTDSVQTSTTTSDGGSSSDLQQEGSSAIKVPLEDSSLAEKKPKSLTIWKQEAGSQALPFGNEAPDYNIGSLNSDSKIEKRLQLLEKQLLQQRKQYEILRSEVKEKQKRYEEVELKLQKVASENARISEENSRLREENKWAEKTENENADLQGKLSQATEERDSALRLVKGLEGKVENLENIMKIMEERAENQHELELEHKKSYQELQENAGEIQLLQLQSDHQRPFRLYCFLARYSYDPSSGPNESPEAELPLTAGEYVYICGEMDENGFYVGELMDGRRGFVPSNLVEEVAGNGLFRFIPSEPSDISDDTLHEPSFSCQSVSSLENSNSPGEDICVSLLADGPEGTPGEVHPPNLTLILNLRNITTTSAEIKWLPSNRNCPHRVYLDGETYDVTKAGINCYTFPYLTPSRRYHVKVEPLVPIEALLSPQGGLELKAGELTFTTPSAGPPDAPRDVQVQTGSSADILIINWSPVRIRPSRSSTRVPVIGYAIYISGQKVTEIMSPTTGSVSIEVSQINTFQGPQTVTVRTVSPFGESADSVPAFIPSNLQKGLRSFSSLSLGPGVTCEELFESEGSEDSSKRRLEACLTKNALFNFKPDHRETSADDSSAENSLETWDANSSSPESSLSSIHQELRKDPDVDTSAEDTFPQKDQGKQIEELCQDLAESTMSSVESQEEKTFKTGSGLVSVTDNSQGALLSDMEDEEEEEEEEDEDSE